MPRSSSMMRLVMRSRKARSWVMTMAAGTFNSSSSSRSMPSMSRWLVGSSSSSRSGCKVRARASAARLRSPPELVAGERFSSSSKRCRNSVSRDSRRHRSRSSASSSPNTVPFVPFAVRARSNRLSRSVSAGGNSGSCSTKAILTVRCCWSSPSSRWARPAMILQQGGLTGAVTADQAEPFPGFHGKLRAIQERAVAEGEVCVEKCDECHVLIVRIGRRRQTLYSGRLEYTGARSAPAPLAVCHFRRTSIQPLPRV